MPKETSSRTTPSIPPRPVSFWRTRKGLLIILVASIVIVGAVVGRAVGGNVRKHNSTATANHNSTSGSQNNPGEDNLGGDSSSTIQTSSKSKLPALPMTTMDHSPRRGPSTPPLPCPSFATPRPSNISSEALHHPSSSRSLSSFTPCHRNPTAFATSWCWVTHHAWDPQLTF